jgi:hypothetical protein
MADICPPQKVTAAKVYTLPGANNGRYLLCKKNAKGTFDCTLRRWHFDSKMNVVDEDIDLGSFAVVTSEGDKCIKWPKPGKDGVAIMRNECAASTERSVATCVPSSFKGFETFAPRVLKCGSDTYPEGKGPVDIECKE